MAPSHQDKGRSRGERGANRGGRAPGGRDSSRGRGRGRGGPRIDKDGDVAMGAEPFPKPRGRGDRVGKSDRVSKANPRSRGKEANPTNRKDQRYKEKVESELNSPGQHSRTTKPNRRFDTLLVKGLVNTISTDSGEDLARLKTWLQRKSKSTIRSIESVGNDDVHIQVSTADTQKFLGLNGFSFETAELDITLLTRAADAGVNKELKETLASLLESRYNEQTALLDLSSLGDDPLFEGYDKKKRETILQGSSLLGTLCSVCSERFSSGAEKRDKIRNVSLANNNISNLDGIQELCQYFPLIQGLDLSNNKIRKANALMAWRRKFKALSLLVVSNNPFTLDPVDHTWQEDLIKWFPSLTTLNDMQVRSEEEAARNSALRSVDFKIAAPHIQDTSGTVVQFMYNLVAGYDNKRSELAAAYYDNNATFTLCDLTQDRSALNTAYTKRSRNLSKVSTPTARMDRLFVGTHAIQTVWAQLPATRHPDLDQETDQWCVESQLSPASDGKSQSPVGINGHNINAHGKFEEVDENGNRTGIIRSFDRSILIVPGGGYQNMRVVSDQLTIRDESDPEAWRPGKPAARATQTAVAAPNGNGTASNDLTLKENLVQELMRATSLTRGYATMCLESGSWDKDAAWALWQKVGPTLGREAFVQQPQQPPEEIL